MTSTVTDSKVNRPHPVVMLACPSLGGHLSAVQQVDRAKDFDSTQASERYRLGVS